MQSPNCPCRPSSGPGCSEWAPAFLTTLSPLHTLWTSVTPEFLLMFPPQLGVLVPILTCSRTFFLPSGSSSAVLQGGGSQGLPSMSLSHHEPDQSLGVVCVCVYMSFCVHTSVWYVYLHVACVLVWVCMCTCGMCPCVWYACMYLCACGM